MAMLEMQKQGRKWTKGKFTTFRMWTYWTHGLKGDIQDIYNFIITL